MEMVVEDILFLEVEEELRKRKRDTDQVNYEKDEKRRRAWEATVQLGRDNLWEYCRLKSPTYYTEDKKYLKELVDTLEKFYKGELLKDDGTPYKKIMINIPPRHGKSRTLVNLTQWILGRNQNERIIECSYNDDAAGDFAKFTRDGITEERISDDVYVFSDFFPEVRIKRGSNSYYKWALDGQFFNYLGAGIGGSITGKGGSILIIDDPIKLAEEAFNEERLEKIWSWYTNTFLSRGDAVGGEPLEVIVMTRWSNNDICGRILDGDEKSDWYVFKLEAYDEENDSMLCEEVLSKKRYLEFRKKLAPEILRANYHQETVDRHGRLYKIFKTYEDVPRNDAGMPLSDGIYNYTDTADEGSDFLCSINYMLHQGEAYVLDVLYTKDGMEITEPKTAEMFAKDNLWKTDGKPLPGSHVNVARIESNNGGRGFARNIQRELRETHGTIKTVVRWFHQSKNKKARILSNSSFVQEHIYFPVNWADKWSRFHRDMTTYLKEGKKQHDDGPDAVTGIAENIGSKVSVLN